MTTEEMLRLVLDSRLMDLHTSMPGIVEKYDASKQLADVKPQLKRAVSNGQGGYVIEDLPVLSSVPVGQPRGGGYFAAFPLKKGDTVWLIFAERNLNAWRQKGEPSDPGDLRMHSLAGAFAIPCGNPTDKAIQDASADNLVIGKDGTSGAQIEITSSMVKLGGGDQFVALANLVKQRLDAIQDAFDNHVHSFTYSAGPTSGTTGTTAVTGPLGALADVAAQNVKAT